MSAADPAPTPRVRLRWGRLALVGISLVALLLVRQGACAQLAPVQSGRHGDLVLGALHVHSVASDGLGTIEEIAAAAKEAGLSFVVMTDHNVTPAPAPRRVDGVLVVHGVEVSTSDGHLLVLGAEGTLPPPPRTGAQAVAWGEAQRGFLALAHPVQRKNPWKDAESGARVPGFELYSADTLFRDALARPLRRLLPSALGWLGDRRHGVLGLVDGQPEVHDALLQREGVPVTLCSHDAHGYPPYRDVFATMATAVRAEVLEGSDAEAATGLIREIASGRSLCVFQALGSPAGFGMHGVPGSREVPVGAEIIVELPEDAPAGAELRIFGPARLREDGRAVVTSGEGLLQLEVWAQAPGRFYGTTMKPWLVPAPIRVVR